MTVREAIESGKLTTYRGYEVIEWGTLDGEYFTITTRTRMTGVSQTFGAVHGDTEVK